VDAFDFDFDDDDGVAARSDSRGVDWLRHPRKSHARIG